MTWHDKETGLEWEISDRSLPICREALKHFDVVWMDSLCIIQCSNEHKVANLNIMGRIYYHGTVCPEMVAQLSPEYSLRGWVQQEISFTKLKYVIKPLLDFTESHREQYERCLEEFKETKTVKSHVDIMAFNQAINDSMPYFNTIIRICEGRESVLAKSMQEKLSKLMTELQRYAMMYGSYGSETLQVLFNLDIPFCGDFEREMSGKCRLD
jgi:hypothetical protein